MDKKEINISISSESSSPKEGKGNKFSIKTKFKVLGILGILGIWYLIGPLLSDEKKEYTAIKDECPSYYSPTSTRLVQKTFTISAEDFKKIVNGTIAPRWLLRELLIEPILNSLDDAYSLETSLAILRRDKKGEYDFQQQYNNLIRTCFEHYELKGNEYQAEFHILTPLPEDQERFSQLTSNQQHAWLADILLKLASDDARARMRDTIADQLTNNGSAQIRPSDFYTAVSEVVRTRFLRGASNWVQVFDGGVEYEINDYHLIPHQTKFLREMATLLSDFQRAYPNLRIIVQAYTDNSRFGPRSTGRPYEEAIFMVPRECRNNRPLDYPDTIKTPEAIREPQLYKLLGGSQRITGNSEDRNIKDNCSLSYARAYFAVSQFYNLLASQNNTNGIMYQGMEEGGCTTSRAECKRIVALYMDLEND